MTGTQPAEPQLVMQYPIALPRDYDMAIIRRRIEARGAALDDRAGLLFKAYCVREIATGAAVNEYAPFYVWHQAPAAAAFLWRRGGFQGIVADFGRPTVRTWLPVAHRRGDVATTRAHSAVLRTTAIAADANLEQIADELTRRIADFASSDTHHAVAGIDPTGWRTVEFISGRAVDASGPGWTRYSVLHVSEPS